jgi:hypothetical protein
MDRGKPPFSYFEYDPFCSLNLRVKFKLVIFVGRRWREMTRDASAPSFADEMVSFAIETVFTFKISLSKLHYSPITSNLLPHAWNIKYR